MCPGPPAWLGFQVPRTWQLDPAGQSAEALGRLGATWWVSSSPMVPQGLFEIVKDSF